MGTRRNQKRKRKYAGKYPLNTWIQVTVVHKGRKRTAWRRRRRVKGKSVYDTRFTSPPLFKQAMAAHLERDPATVLRDNASTSKRTLDLSEKNFEKWKRAPGRYDLRGVDTAIDQSSKAEITEALRFLGVKQEGRKADLIDRLREEILGRPVARPRREPSPPQFEVPPKIPIPTIPEKQKPRVSKYPVGAWVPAKRVIRGELRDVWVRKQADGTYQVRLEDPAQPPQPRPTPEPTPAPEAPKPSAKPKPSPEENIYASMTVKELRDLAQIRKIHGRSKMKKAELVAAHLARDGDSSAHRKPKSKRKKRGKPTGRPMNLALQEIMIDDWFVRTYGYETPDDLRGMLDPSLHLYENKMALQENLEMEIAEEKAFLYAGAM
jgi:hypothetical protein